MADDREAIKIALDGPPVDSLRGAQLQAVQAADHEPTARGSAPSGDSCDARLPRAPQEISESPGSPFRWLRSFVEAKESDLLSGNPRLASHWPRAATERVGGDEPDVLKKQAQWHARNGNEQQAR